MCVFVMDMDVMTLHLDEREIRITNIQSFADVFSLSLSNTIQYIIYQHYIFHYKRDDFVINQSIRKYETHSIHIDSHMYF